MNGGVDGSLLVLAASTGALSLLTPCVFPMVPITVSYFTQHASTDRRGAARNALCFAGGIIGAFTALGFTLALAVGATGVSRFAASPVVNLFITAFFLFFAGNLLGWYQVAIPGRIATAIDRLTRKKGSNGSVGAVVMGVLFTVTSFTCTAPFIGTLLVMAANGNWPRPLIGMIVYSMVFSLPFLALAMLPQWMVHLPKAGGWLNSVKVVLGLLEIAAATKFIANVDLVWHWGVITRGAVIASWMVLMLIVALYLVGRVTFPHDVRPPRIGWPRVALALVSVAFAAWLGSGLGSRSLGELESFLPPRVDTSATVPLAWLLNDLPAALSDAKATGRNVFIDFTGYTCTNCRWMEANMFTQPQIIRALQHFRLARLFTDGEGALYEQQQALQQRQFGTVALPLYAVVDDRGRTLATFSGLTRDRAEFLAFLERAAAAGRPL